MKCRHLSILLTFILLLTACAQNPVPAQPVDATLPGAPEVTQPTTAPAPIDEEPFQRLSLTITPDENAYQTISEDFSEDLTEFGITYIGVSNVMITLDDRQLSLEDALTAGKITPEEIICYAQLDANNGFCYEYPVSNNGLTKLVYNYYDQFDLVVFYDVYETPVGKQHLIKELDFCQYYAGRQTSFGFVDLDREDWGLTIETSDITPSGVTLHVTQQHGQHIGTLYIEEYALVDQLTQKVVHFSSDGPFINLFGQPGYTITDNSVTEITLDWSETHGELPSGTYELVLLISDQYDETDKHPLMKNFQDSQYHYIEFAIP